MEYRAIMLVSDYKTLDSGSASDLNEWFAEGWEFVEAIGQPISTGTGSVRRGAVIVIIKRNKAEKGVNLS